MRRLVDRSFAAAGLQRRTGFEVNDIPMLLELAAQGLAITMVPESVAAARVRDTRGAPRGPYCNMGTCFDCLVEVRIAADANHSAHASWRVVRACLATVASDLEVRPAVSAQALVDPS